MVKYIDRCECGHKKTNHKRPGTPGKWSPCEACSCNYYRYSYDKTEVINEPRRYSNDNRSTQKQ